MNEFLQSSVFICVCVFCVGIWMGIGFVFFSVYFFFLFTLFFLFSFFLLSFFLSLCAHVFFMLFSSSSSSSSFFASQKAGASPQFTHVLLCFSPARGSPQFTHVLLCFFSCSSSLLPGFLSPHVNTSFLVFGRLDP